MKCKLCLKENKLSRSHIIPEFFYKPLYDEKHRINVLSLSHQQQNNVWLLILDSRKNDNTRQAGPSNKLFDLHSRVVWYGLIPPD